MKAAKVILILTALPLLLTCGLFSGPYDRDNPRDPLSPNFGLWHGVAVVDSANDVGWYASLRSLAGNVFISYFDATKGQVRFASSADGGLSWATNQVGNSANTAGNPSTIAIRQNGSLFDIVLVYQDWKNLLAKKSPDSSANWVDAAMHPDVVNTVLNQCSLAVGTGADDTYYAGYYVQGVDGDLWFAKSQAGGGNWTAGTAVDLAAGDRGKFNSIAVSGSTVFIAYQSGAGAGSDILMTNSITGGGGWSTPTVVGGTSAATLGGTSVAAADTQKVYVVYSGGAALCFARSSDGGGTFSAPLVVNADAGVSPSLAFSGGKLYVSHFHAVSGDLLFTRSDDLGATWMDPPIVVDTGLGTNLEGKSTSIAVDGTAVYIAYYDAVNGDLKVARSIDNGNTW